MLLLSLMDTGSRSTGVPTSCYCCYQRRGLPANHQYQEGNKTSCLWKTKQNKPSKSSGICFKYSTSWIHMIPLLEYSIRERIPGLGIIWHMPNQGLRGGDSQMGTPQVSPHHSLTEAFKAWLNEWHPEASRMLIFIHSMHHTWQQNCQLWKQLLHQLYLHEKLRFPNLVHTCQQYWDAVKLSNIHLDHLPMKATY